MPLLRLHIAGPDPTPAQTTALQEGLTRLMAATLGKRADLTVIGLSSSPPHRWSRGGVALDDAGWTATLIAHLTAGTNTEAEQATFIAQAHALIADTFGCPATAPIYVIVDEIPATGWGYDGRTQQARRVAPSPEGR